jgi:long-subunit acyl-CoA synthetase (AMP-forming)
MKGILDKPEANAVNLVDGWVLTGDVGRLKKMATCTGWEEEEMIKVSGFPFPEKLKL